MEEDHVEVAFNLKTARQYGKKEDYCGVRQSIDIPVVSSDLSLNPFTVHQFLDAHFRIDEAFP